MNELFFSDEHYALQQDVRQFLSENRYLFEQIDQKNEVPISLIKKLGGKGFIGPLIPKAYGGIERGMIAHCMITEEISKLNAAVSVTRTPCILMGYLVNNQANEEQKERLLKEIAMGKKLCSICITEKDAGSNVA